MGMGHSSATVKRACELHKAGFRCGQISGLLETEMGVRPHEVTVRRWVDPDYAEAQRERRSIGGTQARRAGWKPRLKRLRDLQGVGVPYPAIAKVANLDFGLSLSEHDVREVLARQGLAADKLRRLLDPKFHAGTVA
jgi:hypothetical protein